MTTSRKQLIAVMCHLGVAAAFSGCKGTTMTPHSARGALAEWSNPPVEAKSLHIAVLDCSPSSMGGTSAEELGDQAIAAADLGGRYVKTRLMSWHKSANSVTASGQNDSQFEEAVRTMVRRGGQHTPVAPMLAQLLAVMKLEPAGTKFTITIGTRSPDPANSEQDLQSAHNLAGEIAKYQPTVLVHGLHAAANGYIDRFEQVFAPLGKGRLFISSDSDFESAKAGFFKAAR